MPGNDNELKRYSRSGRDTVQGWLSRCDSEMFASLLGSQSIINVNGGVAEIGVHHGKSFILLALSNKGRNCYAVDLFGRQELNIDQSGSGDRQMFSSNLRRFGVDDNGIHIDERSSFDVRAADVEAAVGKVRFFHIDGGHHLEAVKNDLSLAISVLAKGGIVAVDDVFRPEWPEVSIGLFEFLAHQQTLVPFAIGFNKTFLCQKEFAEFYRRELLKDQFLQMYLTKACSISGSETLVFQRYPLPEWRIGLRVFNYLRTYHPEVAIILFKLFRLNRTQRAI